jgi:hypothetical protein
MMWEIKATDEYEKRLKHYRKKRPRELAAVLNNLDTYYKALSGGTKPKQVTFGFVHAEPSDVIAIDQKGGGPLSLKRGFMFIRTQSGRPCT